MKNSISINYNNKVETPVFFFIYNVENYYHFIYDTLPYLYYYFEVKKSVSNLKLLIENHKMVLNDFDTISQLSTFIRVKDSYKAESGYHDDLVMTLVLLAWASRDPYFKELTNVNLRNALFENQMKQIEDLRSVMQGVSNSVITQTAQMGGGFQRFSNPRSDPRDRHQERLA